MTSKYYFGSSVRPIIHLSIHPSIYQYIHQSVNPSIYQSINLSFNLSIYLSIHSSINLSIYLSIYPSNKVFPPAQSPTPSIYLSSKVRRCRKLAEKDSLIASQSTNFNQLYHRGHHIYVVSLAHFISSLCLFLFVYLSFFVFIYFSYLYIYQ